MTDEDALVARVVAAMAAARAPGVVDALVEALRTHAPDADVVLWLGDYGQGLLRSFPDGTHELPVEGSVEGRVFASGRAHAEGDRLWAPVVSRGDRLGVLALRTASPGGPSLRQLAEVAEHLATALLLASQATDVYDRPRRRTELTLAAELQWSLLPGRSYRDDEVTVAGYLEPAYAVSGDAYDWVRQPGTFAVSAYNGTGRGVPASLVSTIAVTAVRNARRAGLPLPDRAALADQALYAHYGGQHYVSALLVELDLAAGTASVVDAGSPRLLRVRDGAATWLELDEQLPLGMFEESIYRPQPVDVRPGDRLFIVSDGALDALDGPGSSSFGRAGMESAARGTRLLAAPEAVRHVARDLERHRGGRELEDDAVVLCVDWHAAGASTPAPQDPELSSDN
ncbi:serine phosphatase RsbU (regulator of sigma subunit) [Motilibacter rhizosphaerae]|uniref:Serine phosphatase RsbU (Regulator of sigma subunit) n=1 Tax=Motilibacter rhizosphaerae TaxID=598652 RepID=A0A4Q7NWW9_9ACTN|nr:PP2C family protein-serine/threonine phosphatase [Motilibacter rhizosphaerae]RZS91735.1 serine phosphatase RsbU (regulator of sigma subunit) [Motilibacter rhizosphaerae]